MLAVVVIGVVLVVSCIVLLFLPYGEKYKTSVQRFSGLGVQLEISLLTVLALAGMLMTLVPVAFPLYREYRQLGSQLEDAQDQIEVAQRRIEDLQQALAKAQKFDLWALVTLEGVTEADRPKPTDVECTYLPFGAGEPVRAAAVKYGVTASQYRILLTDVDRSTVLQRLVVEQPGKRRWAYENLVPMEPSLLLKRER